MRINFESGQEHVPIKGFGHVRGRHSTERLSAGTCRHYVHDVELESILLAGQEEARACRHSTSPINPSRQKFVWSKYEEHSGRHQNAKTQEHPKHQRGNFQEVDELDILAHDPLLQIEVLVGSHRVQSRPTLSRLVLKA